MSPEHDDDEGTVIRPGTVASAGVAPAGQVRDADRADGGEDSLSLRIGARVAEFEVVQRIGEGGFSIVYLAKDHSLERTVALKEYLPSSLAMRVGTTQVQPRSQRYRDTFEAGLKSFVNEAKLLAQFDHPSLVKVYRFWEANGTAYMVMPFYQGVTVKDAIRAMPRPPDEAWLLALLAPLTDALSVIHAEHCYHRDIAPDNVILLAGSGKPLLLDFGAARRVIGDTSQGLTVILKAGYAPVEQYAEIPGMKQGTWTDVYALAAVVYWAITGSTPPPSVGRTMNDTFVPLARCAADRYSLRFLQTIDHALIVLPEQRTQTIEAFRRELGLAGEGSASPPPVQWTDSDATVIRPPGYRSGPATITQREPRVDRTGAAEAAPTARPSMAPAETRSGRRRLAYAATAAGAVAAAAGIWWTMQRPSVAPAPRAAGAAASEVAPQSATPAAADAPVVAAPEAAAPSTAAPAAPLPQPTSTPETAAQTTPAATATGVATEAPKPAATEAAKPPATASPPAPVEPVDEAPAPPAAKAPAPPPKRAAAPHEQGADHASPRSDAGKRERVRPDSADSAECARILQRLSLGESSPELVERLKALNCR